jgi:hypothetical protein
MAGTNAQISPPAHHRAPPPRANAHHAKQGSPHNCHRDACEVVTPTLLRSPSHHTATTKMRNGLQKCHRLPHHRSHELHSPSHRHPRKYLCRQ